LAAFSSRSVVPAASGSLVNARIIGRRFITSLNSTPPAKTPVWSAAVR
jgi:hypothetical protein